MPTSHVVEMSSEKVSQESVNNEALLESKQKVMSASDSNIVGKPKANTSVVKRKIEERLAEG